ncbi:squalene-hopene-cyclase [Xylaria arbuscula]|nr:squalene-hopene-cyclase [Xylaria arbuscula]
MTMTEGDSSHSKEKYWPGLKYKEVPDQQQNEPSSSSSQPNEQQQALRKGSSFLRQLQMEDGSWGPYCDGPMFVTSSIVFACYIVGIPIPRPLRLEMCRYLVNTFNADGGSIYLYGPSTVFGTGTNYMMLRILGLGPEHPACKRARDLLISKGGRLGILTWASFQLNPANWWMPIRTTYMSMSYLFGHWFQALEEYLIRAVRGEIYAHKSYNEIQNWSALRSYINTIDLVQPKSIVQSGVVSTLSLWEWLGSSLVFNRLRARGLKEVLLQVEADVHTTEYCAYAPAYWAVGIIALSHAHGRNNHWTSLSVQAICSYIQLSDNNRPTSADLDALEALESIRDSQVLHDPIEMHRTHRYLTKCGWPYSTRMQGYIVSDVTAETIIAILQSRRISSLSQRISIEHLQLAVDSLVRTESGGSGFAAYEKVRWWELLEFCNITNTRVVLMALAQFNAEHPKYRLDGISHYGVYFSFATMWALQGLACAGYTEQNSPAVAKACAFLLKHQNRDDGGWGEALKSYRAKDFVAEREAAHCSNRAAIKRCVRYLTKTQQPNGEWLPGTLEAIYTPPCGYRYPLYKFHFTLKALAGYTRRYENKSPSTSSVNVAKNAFW